ncbi:MAG: hypothetical protein ABG776_20195, partial [Cyanobacteria bacterium J06555_13]
MARTYLKTYFKVLCLCLFIIGLINFSVDPLWLHGGNRVTGINLPSNERITKTNLLLQSTPQDYDCFLFGTSRLTLMNSTALKGNTCFNYAFSAGKPEEFLNYARYIKANGFEPDKVYVEIIHTPAAREGYPIEKAGFIETVSEMASEGSVNAFSSDLKPYFFSLDTLWSSLKSVLLKYPVLGHIVVKNPYPRLYDHDFHAFVSKTAPVYEPTLVEKREQQQCDRADPKQLNEFRALFPDAELVGFVAPLSAWRIYNRSYAKNIMNCQLEGIHQAAQYFDRAYDFSIPSPMTTRTDNTYDGNHYYPAVFETVA